MDASARTERAGVVPQRRSGRRSYTKSSTLYTVIASVKLYRPDRSSVPSARSTAASIDSPGRPPRPPGRPGRAAPAAPRRGSVEDLLVRPRQCRLQGFARARSRPGQAKGALGVPSRPGRMRGPPASRRSQPVAQLSQDRQALHQPLPAAAKSRCAVATRPAPAAKRRSRAGPQLALEASPAPVRARRVEIACRGPPAEPIQAGRLPRAVAQLAVEPQRLS